MNPNAKISDLTVVEFSKLMYQLNKNHNQSDSIGIDEVSKITGYSKSAIYKLVSARAIPYFKNKKNGRKLNFSRKSIMEWTLDSEVKTMEELVNYKR